VSATDDLGFVQVTMTREMARAVARASMTETIPKDDRDKLAALARAWVYTWQECPRCGGTGNNDDRDSTDDTLCPRCGGNGERPGSRGQVAP
jgi:rRNA maturation protein Nop10